jgi:hypothetical protein
MPRNVRNFWIDVEIDGQKTRLRGGPQGREGGLRLSILQRSEGAVSTALIIDCYVNDAGDLVTMTDAPKAQGSATFATIKTAR